MQNVVMPDELQANSYLLNPRDLVVSVPRIAETSQASQPDSQQDTKIINGAGGGVPTLNRANAALSRWYPAPKMRQGFPDPTF